MSLLTRTAPDDTADQTAGPALQSPFALGLLSAGQAATASLLCVLLPVVGVWMVSARTTAAWSEALRIGADAWLLAHHTGIAVPAGHVGLVPLGLTVLPAAWCWAAGRRMGLAMRGRPPAGLRRAGIRALASFVGCYAVLVVVVSLVAATPVARPLSAQALLGGTALALLATGPALLRALLPVSRRSVSGVLAQALRLPAPVRRAVPGAVVALATWLAAGSVVAAVALVAGLDRVLALHRALDPGGLGGAGLTLAQLALVPVVVLWGAAWVAGPGFAVGIGTSVTPAVTVLGPLPAFPLLGGLPEPGEHHGALALVVAVPVLGGVLAGILLRRRQPALDRRHRILDALVVGLLAGAGAGLLASLASGPAGPGRLEQVGPSVVLVAVAVAAEVAAGAVVAVLLSSDPASATAAATRAQLGRLGSRVRSATRSS